MAVWGTQDMYREIDSGLLYEVDKHKDWYFALWKQQQEAWMRERKGTLGEGRVEVTTEEQWEESWSRVMKEFDRWGHSSCKHSLVFQTCSDLDLCLDLFRTCSDLPNDHGGLDCPFQLSLVTPCLLMTTTASPFPMQRRQPQMLPCDALPKAARARARDEASDCCDARRGLQPRAGERQVRQG